jgi:hypothetical protein
LAGREKEKGKRKEETAETRERREQPLTGQPEIEQDNEKTYSLAHKLNRTPKKSTRVAKSLTRVAISLTRSRYF